MKRFTLIFFILAAIGIVLLIWNRDLFTETKITQQAVPKTVSIQNGNVGGTENKALEQTVFDETQLASLIPLASDETFIQSIIADVNGDGFDDQVSLIKKTANPFLQLIVVLYDPKKAIYYNAYTIETPVTQLKAFSFFVKDIVGERTNSLVYSGITAENESVFCVFLPHYAANGSFTYVPIANLRADGSIFVEEISRSDSYDTNEIPIGESFPIWVYSSDPESPPNSLDQIHTKYVWDSAERIYKKTSSTKIQGSKIEAKELERILDGNVKTFENFLGGLWYKPTSTDETQYLFFNPSKVEDEREVIFLRNDGQEIYRWNTSSLRRNGIYLTTSNKSITTLVRKFDITLSAIDEIKLKINEDVQMKISEESSWNGTYKKMGNSLPITKNATQEAQHYNTMTQEIQNNPQTWLHADGSVLHFTKATYTITFSAETADEYEEKGSYALMQIDSSYIIQFRPSSKASVFANYYKIDLHITKNADGSIREVLSLMPVKLSLHSIEAAGGKSFTFERTLQ